MIAKRKDPAVTVRFPREVLDRATRAARANGRSRNSEIVMRLAQSFGAVVPRGKSEKPE